MRGTVMKTIVSSSLDAACNLELEKRLLEEGKGESFVLFWQSHNTIVLGRHQRAESEINMEEAQAAGTSIVRRITGGGAVYQDLGNLNFSIITDSDGTDSYRKFLNPVVRCLMDIGVPVTFNDRNDLLIEGRKFSGSAQLVRNGRVLHHGTLLIHSDLEWMDRLLVPHPEKLARNQVVSVRARVVNLWDYLPGDLRGVEPVRNRLLEYLKKVPYLLSNSK